jgi:D-alanine transaminase
VIAPLKNNLVLEGIRYGLFEELCAEVGVPFELRVVSEAETRAADELLMSSATREVLPVVELDGKPVGSGKAGPVYQKLRAAYDARIAALV